MVVYTWIVGLLKNFAYLPTPAALAGYFLLCVAQGHQLTLWAMATRFLQFRGKVAWTWAAVVAMIFTEWTYPFIFDSYFANSQYKFLSVIQSLDLWGPLGVGALLAAANGALFESFLYFRRLRPFPASSLAGVAALLLANQIYGFARMTQIDAQVASASKSVNIGMVQVNMGIYEKTENPAEGLRRHREQSLELQNQGAELIIWPESGFYFALPKAVRNVKGPVMGELATPLLFGGLTVERQGEIRKPYNSAILADAQGNVLGTYDKNILLALGEYIPFGDMFPFIYEISPNTSHFYRGVHQNSLELNGVRYGALICYEDILPDFVRRHVQQGAEVLVNMTNDAWYGRSHEPQIHLALAALRSVENRRFLARSTNTGISAFVDPVGRIISPTPIFERANISAKVVPMQNRTFYTMAGDWLGWLALGCIVYWLRFDLQKFVKRVANRQVRVPS